ncbi:hypothetical protein Fot_06593 [Forsythia ovata]|uniref:Uncharacterized protein n=1 Tax=Forsythia ovata TaxID=205694 RepID=A0ABD1VGK5_9LAMI
MEGPKGRNHFVEKIDHGVKLQGEGDVEVYGGNGRTTEWAGHGEECGRWRGRRWCPPGEGGATNRILIQQLYMSGEDFVEVEELIRDHEGMVVVEYDSLCTVQNHSSDFISAPNADIVHYVTLLLHLPRGGFSH